MNPLEILIRNEITRTGPLPFQRFMEMALYTPELGYYERQTEIGKAGDFYTSVSVGELFGQLLAYDLSRRSPIGISDDLESAEIQIVEAGAHRGQLALDILNWFRQWRPNSFAQMQYWIIEPSPIRKAWQQETLRSFGDKVRWSETLFQLPQIHGVILSNELLDAFPVHRLRWNAATRNWDEWHVGCDAAGFNWQSAPMTKEAASSAPGIPPQLADVMPDGFTTEVCPSAVQWWIDAARKLTNGILMTIDYGLESLQFLDPARSQGTLRSYRRHQNSNDILSDAGERDLTAHVNFTAVREAGERTGLKTSRFLSQSEYLTRVFEDIWHHQSKFAPWTPARLRQFQTLTHPEHLGRAFHVLIQTRSCTDEA